MSDTEEDKQTGNHEAKGDQGCPVEMHGGRRCGRPIHPASPGVDSEPVCLMHSRDPNKDKAAFEAEFERILSVAGNSGTADFSYFVFPLSSYRSRTFTARCLFSHARFVLMADFSEAIFNGEVDFFMAEFDTFAEFAHASFKSEGKFVAAGFKYGATFGGATFAKKADFVGANFATDGHFLGTKFYGEADFATAFLERASFEKAWFQCLARFSEGTFGSKVDFTETVFTLEVDFSSAEFRGQVLFRKTMFPLDPEVPGPIFSQVRVEKPADVLFENTSLEQALFHRCDVSQLGFSDVEWRLRKNGKWMAFDETVDLKNRAAGALNPQFPGWATFDDRNYRLVAELYQQLKKNYDDRRDYWTAGDFHYGEMEMKRLSSRRRNPVLRWLHRNLGLVAWYQYASDYGESYVKPFLRVLIVLALFTLAYPACRLHRTLTESPMPSNTLAQAGSTTACTDEVSYADFFQFLAGYPNRPWRGTASFFVQSFTTSVGVAALRRDFTDYEPQSVLGRFAALIELLLTSTLVALFLLAVRRQFRR